jgi:hypothetical protein
MYITTICATPEYLRAVFDNQALPSDHVLCVRRSFVWDLSEPNDRTDAAFALLGVLNYTMSGHEVVVTHDREATGDWGPETGAHGCGTEGGDGEDESDRHKGSDGPSDTTSVDSPCDSHGIEPQVVPGDANVNPDGRREDISDADNENAHPDGPYDAKDVSTQHHADGHDNVHPLADEVSPDG